MPVYLVLGILLGVAGFILAGLDGAEKGSYFTFAIVSSLFMIVVCALTLVSGFILHLRCKKNIEGKVKSFDDNDDNTGFKKGVA